MQLQVNYKIVIYLTVLQVHVCQFSCRYEARAESMQISSCMLGTLKMSQVHVKVLTGCTIFILAYIRIYDNSIVGSFND